jgi:hypothetical protein
MQVTDRDHLAVGQDGHLEQVGDLGSRRGHGGARLSGLSSGGSLLAGSFRGLVRSYQVLSPAPSNDAVGTAHCIGTAYGATVNSRHRLLRRVTKRHGSKPVTDLGEPLSVRPKKNF